MRWSITFFLFVLFGTLTLSHFSFLQQSDSRVDLVFHTENKHDALWHLALMGAIDRSVPPQNPLLNGQKLEGYHYFNDLFWVVIHKLTGISLLTLYLKVAPIFLAFLFSATTLWLFLKVFANKVLAILGAELTVFGSGFAYLAPIFFPASKGLQSAFWLDQPVHLGINQQLLLSLSIVNVVLVLFFSNYKKMWKWIGVLAGGVIAIKVYAGLLLLSGFGMVSGVQFFKQKKLDLLKIFLLGVVVAIPFVLLIGNGNGFPFWWQPGWFFKGMFESGDRLNYSQWEMLRQEAAAHHSVPRLIILWSVATSLFFVGNFGAKIIGFLLIPFVLWKAKSNEKLFWLLSAVLIGIAFVVPTFFLQKGVVWNTIQFLPYAYVPLGLFLIKGIDVTFKLQSLKRAVIILLLLLSLPTTIQTLQLDAKPTSYSVVPVELIQQIESLKVSNPTQTILLSSQLQNDSLIPAFANSNVYYAEPEVLSLMGSTHEERKMYIERVEKGLEQCKTDEIFVTLAGQSGLKIEQCPRKLQSYSSF